MSKHEVKLQNTWEELEAYYQERQPIKGIRIGPTLKDFVDCYPRTGPILLKKLDKELTAIKEIKK